MFITPEAFKLDKIAQKLKRFFEGFYDFPHNMLNTMDHNRKLNYLPKTTYQPNVT